MDPASYLIVISRQSVDMYHPVFFRKRWSASMPVPVNPHLFCYLNNEAFVVAGADKPFLVFFRWGHDEKLFRCTIPPTAAELPDLATSLACCHNGRYLFVGTASGAIHFIETTTGALFHTTPAHFAAVTSMSFSDATETLLTASADGQVRLWTLLGLQKNIPVATLHTHAGAVTSASISPLGRNPRAYTVGADGYLRVWPSQRNLRIPGSPTCLGIPPMEAPVLIGDESGTLYSVISGEVTALASFPTAIRSLSLDLDGLGVAVTIDHVPEVYVVDINTGAVLRRMTVPTSTVGVFYIPSSICITRPLLKPIRRAAPVTIDTLPSTIIDTVNPPCSSILSDRSVFGSLEDDLAVLEEEQQRLSEGDLAISFRELDTSVDEISDLSEAEIWKARAQQLYKQLAGVV